MRGTRDNEPERYSGQSPEQRIGGPIVLCSSLSPLLFPLSPLPSPLSPLFAFGIANPAMLGWLAVAAVPILIHLLSRRRYREMPWAAMEYLLAAAQRQTRRLLIQQWLLLAIRTLLVALVVLAVAEPYTQRAGSAIAPGGHTHRVLVLDGSYSMAYRPTDKTRFQRAKELARQIVEASPQGDAFTLVLMSTPPRVVVTTPALEPAEIIREIENLRLPHVAADLPATIKAIRQVVDRARRENARLDRHEVYFFTDLQRVTWAPKLPEAAAAAFWDETNELAQTAALLVIDLGQPLAENLAVTSLRAIDPLMTVGRGVQFEAELRNFGGQARTSQPVELLVDRRRIEQTEVDIAPNGTASVRFAHRFDAPADHAIEVRAPGDALDVDNHRFLAAPVRQAIRVLCVDGRPSGRPFRGAADYLAVALAPQSPRAEHGLVQADVAAEGAVMDRNLGAYDCVFLCNVAQFTASEARVLDAYLQSGGNLVLFLGDRVSADRYNRELGGAGEGRATRPHILPARLGAVVDRPPTPLDPLGYRHPIVQAFRGRGEASLLRTPIFKYYKLTLPEGGRATTVLAAANGDPLIVEGPVHRGHVVLVATSADLGVDPPWNGLPVWPSFVPLVQEIVAWCARGQLQQRNLAVGERLEATIAAPAAEVQPSVLTPDGRTHPAQLRTAGDYCTLRYADTMQSGIYVARFGPPIDRDETFTVNVDTVESDLAQVDPEELKDEVWPGIPFVHQTSWQDLGATGPGGPIGGGRRLPVELLYAVLGLLFVETFLGWKMGYHEGSEVRDRGPEMRDER
jgi:hypothetical protein